MFLRNLLEPERKGIFPFLELPPELRNTIHEPVLRFPRAGIRVPSRFSKRHVLRPLVREVDELVRGADWTTNPRDRDLNDIETAPIATVLSLLSVNKQVFEEAMPTFYACNVFHFMAPSELADMTHYKSSMRLQHLKHIYLVYSPGSRMTSDGDSLSSKVFSSLPALSVLEVEANDSRWFKMHPGQSDWGFFANRSYTEPQFIPNIQDLAVTLSKAKTFKLHGDCPRIGAYLRSEVDRLKFKGKPPAQPRKRKRTEVDPLTAKR